MRLQPAPTCRISDHCSLPTDVCLMPAAMGRHRPQYPASLILESRRTRDAREADIAQSGFWTVPKLTSVALASAAESDIRMQLSPPNTGGNALSIGAAACQMAQYRWSAPKTPLAAMPQSGLAGCVLGGQCQTLRPPFVSSSCLSLTSIPAEFVRRMAERNPNLSLACGSTCKLHRPDPRPVSTPRARLGFHRGTSFQFRRLSSR
jgi:hypothetical protein